jgi:hypothetical protein
MRTFTFASALFAVVVASPPLTAQLRDCERTIRPEQLPAASAIVDSARAITDLAAISRSDRPLLFSLVFNEDDSLPSVRPIDKADAIGAVLLMRSLRPQPPSETWAVRVHVVEGKTPALTVERSIYCPPEPDSTPFIIIPNLSTFDLQKADRVPSENLGVNTIEALISTEGQALVVRLSGSTGVKALDDQLVHELRLRRFKPALLDNQPMQAVYRTGRKSPRL